MHLNRESVLEVKDGESLRKALAESEVVKKKCKHYADMAQDNSVKGLFNATANDMEKAVERLKQLSPKYM